MSKQIAVFLENQAGKASGCCQALKDANINLLSLSIADTKDFGILRLIACDNEKALQVLRDAGYLATLVELVGVEVSNRSGALSDLLILLGGNNINVEYMYSYAEVDGHARIAFKTADAEKAVEVLKNAGATVI